MVRFLAGGGGTGYDDAMNVHHAPVGIWDSGVGGLSVLQELQALLPHEEMLYLADGRYCPYGGRSPGEIIDRSLAMTRAVVDRGAKAVVIACNTATTIAITRVREAFPAVPIVGMVPAVKPAAAATRSGRIGVLATPRTATGEVLAALIRQHCPGVTVDTVSAPGLVELVEAGQTSGPEVDAALRPLLAPLRACGVDTLVLGCTHYPFLRDAISEAIGPHVVLVDSGAAVARRTREVLAQHDLLAGASPSGGTLSLQTTGATERFLDVTSRLLALPVVPAAEVTAAIRR